MLVALVRYFSIASPIRTLSVWPITASAAKQAGGSMGASLRGPAGPGDATLAEGVQHRPAARGCADEMSRDARFCAPLRPCRRAAAAVPTKRGRTRVNQSLHAR